MRAKRAMTPPWVECEQMTDSHEVAALRRRTPHAAVLGVQDQQEHHERMSFKDEFRAICRRHGLELDERYASVNRPFAFR